MWRKPVLFFTLLTYTYLRSYRENLIKHLNQVHGIHVEKIQNYFPTIDEFNKFKDQIEITMGIKFSIRQSHVKDGTKKITLCCNREGKLNSVAKYRASKASKSLKTNKVCPSFLKVSINMTYSTVNVVGYIDYHSHKLKLQTIPKSYQEKIRQMLKSGIKEQVVLRLCQRDFKKFKISKKDIFNIKYKFGINQFVHSRNDLESTKLMINMKPGNFPLAYLPNTDSNDMMLVYVPDESRNLQFGPKTCFCIDSTHKTTFYGFLLTTLAFIDQDKTFVPIAWLISGNEKSETIEKFFLSIKDLIKIPRDSALMTDDSPIYSKLFDQVFSKSKHLLCIWHLKKNFKSHCIKYLGKQQLGKALWYFEEIFNEDRPSVFGEKIKLFKKYCLERNEKMWTYFNSQFMKRKEKWALFNLDGVHVRTNMALESFHRILKYEYFKNKQNHRCDFLLSALTEYIKDKGMSKGKSYSFQQRICHKNHYIAMKKPFVCDIIDPCSAYIIVFVK